MGILDVYRHRKMMFTDTKKIDQTFTDEWEKEKYNQTSTDEWEKLIVYRNQRRGKSTWGMVQLDIIG